MYIIIFTPAHGIISLNVYYQDGIILDYKKNNLRPAPLSARQRNLFRVGFCKKSLYKTTKKKNIHQISLNNGLRSFSYYIIGLGGFLVFIIIITCILKRTAVDKIWPWIFVSRIYRMVLIGLDLNEEKSLYIFWIISLDT